MCQPDSSFIWDTKEGEMYWNLSVTKEGEGVGVVTSEPKGISCGSDCSHSFTQESVTLTATSSEGSLFIGWSGDAEYCGNSDTCIIESIDSAKNVTAIFSEPGLLYWLLTVFKEGEGTGTVTSEPEGINCDDDCNHTYTKTSVVLTASPDDDSIFISWSGDGEFCGNELTCTINSLDSAKKVGAIFGT